MGDGSSAMERALASLQTATMELMERENVTPIGATVADRNGLSYGEAPRSAGASGLAAQSGAYQEVAKGAEILASLVYGEEDEQAARGHAGTIHDVRRDPVVLVHADDRNLVIRKTRHGDVAVIALKKSSENGEATGDGEGGG